MKFENVKHLQESIINLAFFKSISGWMQQRQDAVIIPRLRFVSNDSLSKCSSSGAGTTCGILPNELLLICERM